MQKGSKDLHHTDASTSQPNTKTTAGLNPNKLGEKVWGRGGALGPEGGQGRRGAKWLGLTHTHPRG